VARRSDDCSKRAVTRVGDRATCVVEHDPVLLARLSEIKPVRAQPSSPYPLDVDASGQLFAVDHPMSTRALCPAITAPASRATT
jgi:hypothetical protein